MALGFAVWVVEERRARILPRDRSVFNGRPSLPRRAPTNVTLAHRGPSCGAVRPATPPYGSGRAERDRGRPERFRAAGGCARRCGPRTPVAFEATMSRRDCGARATPAGSVSVAAGEATQRLAYRPAVGVEALRQPSNGDSSSLRALRICSNNSTFRPRTHGPHGRAPPSRQWWTLALTRAHQGWVKGAQTRSAADSADRAEHRGP